MPCSESCSVAHLHDKGGYSGWFYRVVLAPEDVPSLGVCLPPGTDGKNLVAFPLVLLMGWVESPPQFCAVTETVADLTNTALREQTPCLRTPHQLDR